MFLVPKGGYINYFKSQTLLSNLDKTLERLVLKNLYSLFRENNIITSFLSGFTSGDSTVNQLMYILSSFRLWERSSSSILGH